MRHALLFGSISLFAAAVGCGGNVEVTSASGAAGTAGEAGSATAQGGADAGGSGAGQGGAGTAGATTGGGGAAGGGGTWADDLAGHYMQMMIGNCINAEEWLSIAPPSNAVQTMVDRNFCGPHSVTPRPGTFAGEAGHVLSLAWNDPGLIARKRRFTAAFVKDYPYTFGEPAPPDYVQGKGALNDMAYVQSGGDPVWQREDEIVYEPDAQGKKHTRIFRASVTMDSSVIAPPEPVACKMAVHLEVAIYHDEPVGPPGTPDEAGVVDVSIPCTYAKDAATPWVRITGDGFENSNTDGTWTDYLGALGVWDKYDGEVENTLWEGFRPILYFEPASPELFFHDVSFAWYMHMESPPPATVN